MGTGIPELDAIIKAINKKTGKTFGGQNWGDLTGITTGSARLDSVIGIGGIPRGRITEIFGWQGSAKTSLALQIMALQQKQRNIDGLNRRDLVVDLEHSITTSFLEGFGIDLDQIIWERPDTAEEALQLCIDYPKSGAIDMVLFDSVDAAQNQRMLGRRVGETDVGGISKDMNFALRQLSKIGPKHDTTFIFINQIKQNPGAMMGNPNVTTGGNALKFYSMLRLELMTGKPSPDLTSAMRMRVKINKTKCGPPPKTKDPIELDFQYGKGFDPYLDLMSWAKSLNVIRYAGPSCKVMWEEGGSWETLASKGRVGTRAALTESPELFRRLKESCALKENPRPLGESNEQAAQEAS